MDLIKYEEKIKLNVLMNNIGEQCDKKGVQRND